MSYNILNKNVNFQGDTQGTIEDIVDTHSTQTISGLKTITHLTGTHVRVTNDVVALGNISASVNISASAFYGDGTNLSNVGATINSAVANRITTVAANTNHLDAESDLTFNTSNKTLELATSGAPTGIFNLYGTLSGSGNISGSAFFGSGANLTGILGSSVSVATNGGITSDVNGLKLDVSVDSVSDGGSLSTADKILLFDADAGNVVKQTTAGAIANLFDPAVSTFNGDVNNRVLTAGGSEVINGEANLTFNDLTNRLTITGDVSGSGFVSASIGHFVTKVEAGAISLSDASGIAGIGLTNTGGTLDVQVSGALTATGGNDKIGISGSIAGYGLEFEGGEETISALKFDAGGLSDTAIDRANDSIVFVDADDSGNAKRDSVVDFVGFIAGGGLSAASGQLSINGLGASADRIITDNGDGSVTPEANLTFSSNTLSFGNGSHPTASVAAASGTDTAGKSLIIQTGAGTGTGAGGSLIFKTTEALGGSGTTVQDHVTAGSFTKKAFTIGGEQAEQSTKTSLVATKGNINHGSATGFVQFSIPNGDHAAAFRIFGTAFRNGGDTAMAFESLGAISRESGQASFIVVNTSTNTSNAGDASDSQRITNVALGVSSPSGGTGGVQTADVQITITVNDSSNSNSVLYNVELLNASNDGITVNFIA